MLLGLWSSFGLEVLQNESVELGPSPNFLSEFTSIKEWFKDIRLCYLVNTLVPCTFLIGSESELLREMQILHQRGSVTTKQCPSGL